MKKIIFTLLTFSFTSVYASAYESGNSLYGRLMSETYVDKAYSMGYVTGVVDSRYHNCNLLKQVQISQLVDSVKLFLVQNPEKRQYSAASIIEYVIQDKFGCK